MSGPPAPLSGVLDEGAETLTVVWSRAGNWEGGVGDVVATVDIGSHSLQNDGPPTSGDGTATHVYHMEIIALDGTPGTFKAQAACVTNVYGGTPNATVVDFPITDIP